MKNIFTDHPHSIGETYWEHFLFACRFSFGMLLGGFACLIHAIFPFLCKTTASKLLLKMTTNFITRMPKLDDSVIAIGSLIEKKLGEQAQSEPSPISASMKHTHYETEQKNC